MDEGVVRFLAFPAPVEARTLLGEVTWSKAIETELIVSEETDSEV